MRTCESCRNRDTQLDNRGVATCRDACACANLTAEANALVRGTMIGMRSALISTLLLLLTIEPACCSRSSVPIFVNTWAFTHATEAGWIALTNSSSKARHLDAIVEVLGGLPPYHSALLAEDLTLALKAVVKGSSDARHSVSYGMLTVVSFGRAADRVSSCSAT